MGTQIGIGGMRSGSGSSSAEKVSYDNTTSGLTATNVQQAIDEVGANLGGFGDMVYLSSVLHNTDNPTTNRQKLQELVDENKKIIVDYDEVVFDDYISCGNIYLVSLVKSHLKFPNSRGFVFDKEKYSADNLVSNISVTSKGHCFDFENEGGVQVYNFFRSIFEKMVVTSQEGHCFYAKDNKSSKGDTRVFSCEFNNIFVKAPNGCGFFGIYGNTHKFAKCSNDACGISVFYNCSGLIESFNGSFGDCSTFYKAGELSDGSALTFRLEIVNSNIEGFSDYIFDCASTNKNYLQVLMIGTDVYVSGANRQNFPMSFRVLYSFDFTNGRIFDTATYASGYCLMSYETTSARVRSSIAFKANRRGTNYIVDPITNTYNIGNAITSATYGKILWENEDHRNIKFLKIGNNIYDAKAIEIPSSGVLELDENSKYYTITNETNKDLNYVSFNNSYDKYGRTKYYIRNSKNTSLKIKNNLGYDGRFRTNTGNDIILGIYEMAELYLVPKELSGFTKDYYYIKKMSINAECGNTRPNTAEIGDVFFDTTLGKPIWWNGSAWVDSTGTAV